MPSARRFPPLWSVEEQPACFVLIFGGVLGEPMSFAAAGQAFT
jgi:hypothetical protein